jgi:hypothetical protein
VVADEEGGRKKNGYKTKWIARKLTSVRARKAKLEKKKEEFNNIFK